jgi:membrane AbrB-like protein
VKPGDAGRLAATLGVAVLGAQACEALGTPLPWFIGPLLATAACSLAGLPVRASGHLRNAGLWAIGTTLGMYFTPEVVALMPGLAPVIAASLAWALLCGHGFYLWLWHCNRGRAGLTRETAFFSAAIGGASEMALMADQRGGRVDLVASAHSLRILLVVLIVPFALQWSGVHGSDVAVPGAHEVRWAGLLPLGALTAAGAALAWRLGIPNGWMLGALAVSVAAAAAGWSPSAFPRVLSNAAQLAIAVALGTRFQPDFVRAAPRWLLSVAAGMAAMISASAAFAWALGAVSGVSVATLVLGTCPGGMTEMSLTAKVLQLGVPTVTMLQLLRYIAVMLLTSRLWEWEARRLRYRAHARTDG